MRNESLKYLLFFLLAAFSLGGCGIFESEPLEEEPEEEIERIYNKTIEQNYSNEFERALIDSAEAVYPPRDSLLALIPPERWNLVPETRYWYFSSFDGVLTPYVLTEDAIIYYSSLVDSLKSGLHQQIVKAEFEYRVKISFSESYEFRWPQWPEILTEESIPVLPADTLFNIYVVEMAMMWDHITMLPSGSSYVHGE